MLNILDSENFAFDLIDSLTSNIAILDSDGVIVAVNEPWRLFALENSDAATVTNNVGKQYLSVCRNSNDGDDEGANAAFIGISAVLQGEKNNITIEYPRRSPEGLRWFTMSVSRFKGSRDGVIVAHTDITKRKQAEEKLQEATQYIKQIISSAQEGVIVYDLNLRYRVWNSFMEELTGMTAGEVLGRHPSELFPFLQASGVLERLERALSGEAPAPVDFPYVVPKTGKSGWASDLSGPLWDTNGEIIGVITTVREITWRNQVKQDLLDKQQLLEKMNCSLEETIEDLRISEDRFRTITSSAQDAIIMLDEGGNISFWNEAAERLFGYTKEEVSGHNLHTLLVPPPFREAHQRAYPHFQHTGQGSAVGKMVELAGLRRDGSEFPLELSLSAVHVKDAWHAIGIVRDITDRKELEQRIIKRNCALERANVELTAGNTALELKRCEAEEAQRELQLLNEKHRIIFDNANDAIIICNMQAQMLAVNPLAVERLGYTHTELMAMLVDQVDSPEEGSHVPERMAKLMEHGHLTFETTHLRKDGASIPTEVSARRITWDGQLAVMSICRDISDRKRVEDELAIRKNQLQALMNHIPDLIWLKDGDGVYLNCNRKFERFFGAGEADIVGKTDYDFVGKDLADFFRKNDLLAMQSSEPSSNEEWLTFADDGQSILVETIKTPAYNSAGEIVGVLGIARDITERNQLATSLKASMSLLNATLESTADGILVVDLHGHITRWNQKFVDLWHIPEEIIAKRMDKPVLDHVLSQLAQPAEFMDKISELYEHLEKTSSDTLLFADGRVFNRYSQPQKIGADIVGRVWSFRDITASKMAEKEIITARDAATAANLVKSEFLSNMSHEIRTPLSAIIGFSELTLGTNLPPRQHDYVLKIQSAGEMLLNIVDDILDFSKIEAGHLKMEQIPFRLDTILANVINTVRQKASDKGLHLQVETLAEAISSLIGDPHRLGQIFINLLNNAVKFTKQGEIVFKTEVLKQDGDRLQLKFSILDTGIGLSTEQIDKLFHAFTQADSSTTRQFGGTGLGLSISKQLVELMGGRIWCESTPGQGSIFSFTAWFGICQASDIDQGTSLSTVNSEYQKRMPCDFSGSRILLVEDNEMNQHLAIELLKDTGAVVDIAGNGKEAVAMVSGGTVYDLVLMDIQMPVMDGYEATRFIRADARYAQLPIIAMTAHAMQEERQKISEAGMTAYIAKPIDAGIMFQVIKSFLPTEDSSVHLNKRIAENTGSAPEIPAIEGLDIPGALKRLDENRKLYLWLLRTFIDKESNAPTLIKEALKAGDTKLAGRLAHTIKAFAGSIGAVELEILARILEAAFLGDESSISVGDALERFNEEVPRLMKELTRHLPAVAHANDTLNTFVDVAVVTPIFCGLLTYINGMDGKAELYLDNYHEELAGFPRIDVMQIKAYLSKFEYATAREALLALATRNGIILSPESSEDCKFVKEPATVT